MDSTMRIINRTHDFLGLILINKYRQTHVSYTHKNIRKNAQQCDTAAPRSTVLENDLIDQARNLGAVEDFYNI